LKADNYNDLIRRRDGYIPLVLVLFVLPDDQSTWLGIADSELTLRRCGYIWRPSATDVEVSNTSTKRISIPINGRLASETFEALRLEYVG
jgi:hypothetical protein